MRTLIPLLILVVFLALACTPGEVENPAEPLPGNPTQVDTASTPLLQYPSMAPPEWIETRPFQKAPPGQAQLVGSGFPVGYEPQEAGYQVANLPSSDLEVQITQVRYDHPINGQVYTKDSVTVQVSSHQSLEARSEHLDLLIGSEESWEYQQISDHLTARFYSESGDGRIWISGPYMISIWSSLDPSSGDPNLDPMVDAFATLYLELYPPD